MAAGRQELNVQTWRQVLARFILLLILLFNTASSQVRLSNSHSSETKPSPSTLLSRAREAMKFSQADTGILHYRASTAILENYQSDRIYPPFFSMMQQQEVWFDVKTHVLRVQTQSLMPGSTALAAATLDDGVNALLIRNEKEIPISRAQASDRNLNAWAVISDWSASDSVQFMGTEVFRDYPRFVLSRKTVRGEQRLYLDPKTGFPVKLDTTEPHYLWGQRHVEYVWSTWITKSGVNLPGAAFMIADGEVERSQTAGAPELLARASVPALNAPTAPAEQPPDLPAFLRPIPPTITQIAPSAWLLSNPGYNGALILDGGQVYVFDATQGEARARHDADAIARLFPGKHSINVVVTDLAWPHVAGVRYWVTKGATIIAHASAREFLQKVIDRRWTLAPDELEVKRRATPNAVSMRFVPIDHAQDLSGDIQLIPIDGIGSETALIAYSRSHRFLWASDYIQTLEEPSLYAQEVIAAAKRAGLDPNLVAAEHLPVSSWDTVLEAQSGKRRSEDLKAK